MHNRNTFELVYYDIHNRNASEVGFYDIHNKTSFELVSTTFTTETLSR